MENKEQKINKATELLVKELEGLNEEGLHEFFIFAYKLNHAQANMIALDQFEEFLQSFENNPFRMTNDKKFKKQLIDNIVKYAFDHMSLLTAAILIKKGFSIEELSSNYYASINAFDNNWY